VENYIVFSASICGIRLMRFTVEAWMRSGLFWNVPSTVGHKISRQ
jgi:hypothetical protein